MTAGNRPTVRYPGRTPPFVLVGLLVLVGFLSYSYWSLSSRNGELETELNDLHIQKKDSEGRSVEIEKRLEKAQLDLNVARENQEKASKQIQDLESQLANVKTDISNKQADVEKYQSQLVSVNDKFKDFK